MPGRKAGHLTFMEHVPQSAARGVRCPIRLHNLHYVMDRHGRARPGSRRAQTAELLIHLVTRPGDVFFDTGDSALDVVGAERGEQFGVFL